MGGGEEANDEELMHARSITRSIMRSSARSMAMRSTTIYVCI